MKSLPYTISLDLALSGKGAVPRADFDAARKACAAHLDGLRRARADGSLELLGVPSRRDDLDAARPVAEKLLHNTTDIAVLGIGGSSLGGQALKTALEAHDRDGPRVSFHDNPDPFSWAEALSRLDLRTARFVAISKSGGTAETLMQVLTAADAIDKAGGGKYLKDHFAVITEPGDGALRKFAREIGCAVLDHPRDVGGRYSVLTVCGALPALLMGIDVVALREGAQAALDAALDGAESAPADGAALHYALAQEGRLHETVLWAYADRLATLHGWWRQLWAESLGKDGQGSTPVGALGPVDQHSQLQLFRDGPGKSLYTILAIDTQGAGLAVPPQRAQALGLDYLAGKTMGDLVDAEARATAQTLSRNGRPVRRIHLRAVDAHSVGALMMHFMLETILMGRLMGVDPFDQPGVEEGKVLARDYLKGG
ncbi:MAG: glucose-6-phosphate isomerase [Alphaproteobacteria bacterium]|nr:glucose-6-phosphate isomerase [Alphaproteobacteria bacterium]MBV9694772.1 glucose-6-phosphate isomerase [Alphaproteobacteria bacterium]